MISFDYVTANDLDGAARAGAGPSARFIAGGTTLIDLMKLDVERPTLVIDLNTLVRRDPSLSAIADLPGGGLRLGALARMGDVAWDDRVKTAFPLVSQALLLAASGQIRNVATIGGNVLQRTRCPYFRDTATACNKRDPGSGCSALHGFNRTHAVLGTSSACIATHPSDLAVALVALDAAVHVRGPGRDGRMADRVIPFTEFHVAPGSQPARETVLRHGEVITAIDLPPLAFAKRSLYFKVRDRASYAFALASAAVALDIEDGRIKDARVALGGVGTKPWRSPEAERALRGRAASEATFRAAADAALAGARAQKDNAFKISLAKRTLVRALTEVAA